MLSPVITKFYAPVNPFFIVNFLLKLNFKEKDEKKKETDHANGKRNYQVI